MTKYQEMAKELVKQTRAQVLLTKTNFTTIAESLGVVRQTVSNNLDRDDIPLSMFLAAQVESGGNPSKAIAAALAGREVARWNNSLKRYHTRRHYSLYPSGFSSYLRVSGSYSGISRTSTPSSTGL